MVALLEPFLVVVQEEDLKVVRRLVIRRPSAVKKPGMAVSQQQANLVQAQGRELVMIERS